MSIATTIRNFAARSGSHRGLRSFARARDGAAAIEFAAVAAPFLALLFAIMETAFVFFAGQSLEYAASQAGRLIMTGQQDAAKWDQAAFKTQICNRIIALFDCQGKLHVNVQKYSSFTGAGTTPPYTNGQLDPSKVKYEPGVPGDVIVVQLYYQWPIYVSLLNSALPNQNASHRLLVATNAFRNEPYK
jgi:Flp pilus assembly protein TadG